MKAGCSTYAGNVTNGIPNGSGILYDLEDAFVAKGNFIDGKIDGKGTKQFAGTNIKLVGPFAAGLENGKFSVQSSNSPSYTTVYQGCVELLS